MKDLKPFPFCGSNKLVYVAGTVECTACHALGPAPSMFCKTGVKPAGAMKGEALSQWNTRSNQGGV